MRILVTASRDWRYYGLMLEVMAEFHADGNTLVVGRGGRGDRWAEQIAIGLGWNVDPYPADWDRYGRGAGLLRNEQMVNTGADACLAFIRPCVKPGCPKQATEGPHGSHGATHCSDLAEAAKIPVRRVNDP